MAAKHTQLNVVKQTVAPGGAHAKAVVLCARPRESKKLVQGELFEMDTACARAYGESKGVKRRGVGR